MNALEYVGVAGAGTKVLFFDFPKAVAGFNCVSRGGGVFRLSVVGRMGSLGVRGWICYSSFRRPGHGMSILGPGGGGAGCRYGRFTTNAYAPGAGRGPSVTHIWACDA